MITHFILIMLPAMHDVLVGGTHASWRVLSNYMADSMIVNAVTCRKGTLSLDEVLEVVVVSAAQQFVKLPLRTAGLCLN
jgi:hypothetical protein